MNSNKNGSGVQTRRISDNSRRPPVSGAKPPVNRQSTNAQPRTVRPPQTRASAETQRQTPARPTQRPVPTRPRSDLSDNLRSQTPLNRQLRKQSAPSEPGTVRRTSTPQQFKVHQGTKKPSSRRRKKSSSFTRSVIILGVAAYLLLLPIIALVSTVLLNSSSSAETGDFRYQIGEGKNIVSRKTYPYTRVRRGNVYYIEMDSLADYCNLTTTGDSKVIRYVVRESSEAVEFLIGQSVAYINGVPERTGGNAYLRDGKVYIPLEFAKRCFLNLDITLDLNKNRITIVRQTDEKGDYLPLDFPYKLATTTGRINFADLDVAIQEQVIAQNQPTLPETGEGGDNQTN